MWEKPYNFVKRKHRNSKLLKHKDVKLDIVSLQPVLNRASSSLTWHSNIWSTQRLSNLSIDIKRSLLSNLWFYQWRDTVYSNDLSISYLYSSRRFWNIARLMSIGIHWCLPFERYLFEIVSYIWILCRRNCIIILYIFIYLFICNYFLDKQFPIIR